MKACCRWGQALASYMLHCTEDSCEFFAALLDWERSMKRDRQTDFLMNSFIKLSEPSRITVANGTYIMEHGLCAFLSTLPHF